MLCWGDDEVHVALRPERIDGMSGATTISVESARVCAVMRSGEVLCRGTEWLGDGFDKHGASPIVAEVLGVRDAVAVRDGCVLLGDGSVRCWGLNRDGQAGDGTRAERLAPVRVRGIGNATAIAVGDRHACALLENGEIACWGWAAIGDGGRAQMRLAPARVPGIEGARAIDARGEITCAALGDGQVACWGGAQLGTLAAGDDSDLTVDPPEDPRVEGRTTAKVPGALDAAAIAVDADHACARTTAGGVVCWGTNLDGELGTGVAGSTGDIVDVEGIPDATRVTAGEYHACALRAGGSVWCWGDGRRGQLGDGTLQSRGVPAKVPGIEDAIDVHADVFYTCAALRDGTVVCWGTTVPRRDGVDRDRIWRTSEPIAGVQGAQRIAVARNRACARLGSGRVVCWGEDSFGALGVAGGAKAGEARAGDGAPEGGHRRDGDVGRVRDDDEPRAVVLGRRGDHRVGARRARRSAGSRRRGREAGARSVVARRDGDRALWAVVVRDPGKGPGGVLGRRDARGRAREPADPRRRRGRARRRGGALVERGGAQDGRGGADRHGPDGDEEVANGAVRARVARRGVGRAGRAAYVRGAPERRGGVLGRRQGRTARGRDGGDARRARWRWSGFRETARTVIGIP